MLLRTQWIANTKAYFDNIVNYNSSDKARLIASLILAIVLTFSPILASLAPIVIIGSPSAEASEIIWDGGGEDNRWSTPENWVDDTVPQKGSVARFDATSIKDVVIDKPVEVAGLALVEGYSGTVKQAREAVMNIGRQGWRQTDGAFIGGADTIDLNGSFMLIGGQFTSTSSQLTVAGNLSVFNNGFNHNQGSVVLDGIEQIVFGDIAFNNLTKEAPVAQVLELQSGKTIRTTGLLKLVGSKDQLLTLRASQDTPTIIDVQGATIAAYLDIQNVKLGGSQKITCTGCTESSADDAVTVAVTEPTATDENGEATAEKAPGSGLVQRTGETIVRAVDTVRGLLTSKQQPPEQSTISQTLPKNLAAFAEKRSGKTPDFAADEPIRFRIELNPERTDLNVIPLEEETTSNQEGETQGTTELTPTSPSPPPTNALQVISRLLKIPQVSAAEAELTAESFTSIELRDPLGNPLPLSPQLDVDQDQDSAVITVSPQELAAASGRPGKYQLAVTIEQQGHSITHTQDFTWGVLAMNIGQSTYQPGEQATIGVGVLDNMGHTVCDASLSLTVTGPDGTVHDVNPVPSQECGPRTVTDAPDYNAIFSPEEPGEYTVELLAALSAEALAQGETRRLDEKFNVVQSAPFVTQRNGLTQPFAAMRIFPPEPYTVRLSIQANQDFFGTITETVPESFKLSNVALQLADASTVTEFESETVDGRTSLAFQQVTLGNGDTAILSYTYDAPNISPQLYTLGPLILTSDAELIEQWSEPRAWQIAADATFNDAATGNWNIGTTWGGACASSCTEGTDYPGTSDIATIDSHTVTLTANSSVHDITIATGGTLSASSFTLDVSGTWNNTGGVFTPGTSTVMLTSTADETITSGGDAFNDLIINDGLVGYWKMDETAADSCVGGTNDSCDSSGYGHDGAHNGSVSIETNVPSLGFTNNRSVLFDANTEWVQVSATEDLENFTAYTLSAWIDPSGEPGSSFGRIVSKNQGGTSDDYAMTYRVTNHRLVCRVNTSTAATDVTGSTDITLASGWNHVACVWDGTNISAYVNGRGEATTTTTGTLDDTNENLCIGRNCTTTARNFTGYIDDVRIYNRAISASEVAALAARNNPATENTAASEFTLADALDVNGDLILNSGELDASATNCTSAPCNITAAAEWHNNGGIFTPRTNTVTFDGTTSSQELQSGGQNFYNMTVSGSGGWTLHDRLEVDNTMSQSAGTLDTSSNNYTIHAGDWDQTAGTFTDNTSTLTLNSSSAQTVNFEDPVYNLQVEDPTETGLIGYWKFDEGQEPVLDSSSNSNTGTFTGSETSGAGVWSTSVNATTTYDNPYAMDFTPGSATDNADRFIDFNDVDALDCNDTCDLTITGWFNLSLFTEDSTILAKTTSQTSGNAGYTLFIDGDNTDSLEFTIKDGTDLYNLLSTTTFTTSGWNHFAVVWDQDSAANSEIYINGVDDNATDTGTIGLIGDTSNAEDFRIGSESDSAEFFDGSLDDIRIYNTVLSAAQITNLANGKYADGDSGTATYTLNTALDTDNDLFIQAGILDVSAANCASASCNITLAGDWNNYSGASGFTDQTGTVTFDGDNATQAINGTTTFYNFSKTESSNDTTDSQLTFEIKTNATFNIANTLTLDGLDSTDQINIRSSTASSRHELNVTNAASVDNLSVQDSEASTSDITCTDCTNVSGNDDAESTPHWVFVSSGARNRVMMFSQLFQDIFSPKLGESIAYNTPWRS